MTTNVPYCPLTVFNKTPGCFEQPSSRGRNLLTRTVYKKQLLATSIQAAPTARAARTQTRLGNLFVCYFSLHKVRSVKKHTCFLEQSTRETTSHRCSAHPSFPPPSSVPWVSLSPSSRAVRATSTSGPMVKLLLSPSSYQYL